MRCNKCGFENPNGSMFCDNCGTNFDAPDQATGAQGQEVRLTDRISKKSPLDFVVIAIGALFVYFGVVGHFIMGTLGLLFISVGIFNPKKTNYCPNCYARKDMSASTCPNCGKRFSVPIGGIIAGVVIVMVGTAVLILMKAA